MRTTTSMIYRTVQTNLNRVNSDLLQVNQQISSGTRISEISDDPVGMAGVLAMRSELDSIASYQDNLAYGKTMATAAETALTQMKELVATASGLALQANNATLTPENRQSVATEVEHLLEQAIELANTKVGGKYIFGGFRTSGYTDEEPSPFIADLMDGFQVNGANQPPQDTVSGAASPILANELLINDLTVPASTPDSVSTVFADASAQAKAEAINSLSEQTGVEAFITPAEVTAVGAVTAGSMDPGDLLINGVDILSISTQIMDQDQDNTLLEAINNQSGITGVTATRNSLGKIILSAEDGRNIQVETTVNGESISHFYDPAAIASPQNMAAFGSVSLHSTSPFALSTDPPSDTTLQNLGLGGGSTVTDEDSDVAGDGLLSVSTIHAQEGNVRYAGDPANNPSIKISDSTILEIAQNGQQAVADTGIFEALDTLIDSLQGTDFTSAQGEPQAENIFVPLSSGDTGLERQDGPEFIAGSFTITVLDHAYQPPWQNNLEISVDPDLDTLESLASKLNGISGLNCAWNDSGQISIQSDDPDRYSFDFTSDSSNALELVGLGSDDLQFDALDQSIAELTDVQDALTTSISDFGAIYNRLQVQSTIYDELELAVQENLSIVEDTDLVEAVMELEAKTVAYEAALAAASKVMELSLVEYL